MTKTLKESRIVRYKHKSKLKPESNNTKSNLPKNLQRFKQKLLSGNGFIIKKHF